MQGPFVRWRTTGHQLEPGSDILRFEVVDLNRIITSAVSNADLYSGVQRRQGHPPDWQVLPLSSFAVTVDWPPVRLAENTGFAQFRQCPAAMLTGAGYQLWPTEVFVDDVADPRNEFHYDLIVAAGAALIPDVLLTGDRASRRAARALLAPRFEAVLALLGEPIALG